jgi:hypothetical protein
VTGVSFEVVSAAGVPIRTFDARDAAIAWARAMEASGTFPGCTVEEVVRTEQRRKIWRTRRHLQVVA